MSDPLSDDAFGEWLDNSACETMYETWEECRNRAYDILSTLLDDAEKRVAENKRMQERIEELEAAEEQKLRKAFESAWWSCINECGLEEAWRDFLSDLKVEEDAERQHGGSKPLSGGGASLGK